MQDQCISLLVTENELCWGACMTRVRGTRFLVAGNGGVAGGRCVLIAVR